MRLEAPLNFSVDEFYRGIHMYQSWDVFPGARTTGYKDVASTLDSLNFPSELTGKRVLEIAPWNGFFSFECVRRGAAEVIALGPDDPDGTGFNQTRDLLSITNVHYIRDSVYNIPDLAIGRFDIVLFLGLIYHLRHPLLALDYLYDCCEEYLFVDSGIVDNGALLILPPDDQRTTRAKWHDLVHLPLVYFSHQDEIGRRDNFNWSFPTLRALRDWISTAGFVVDYERSDDGQWAFVRARKGTREFVPFLEGYNAAMSTRETMQGHGKSPAVHGHSKSVSISTGISDIKETLDRQKGDAELLRTEFVARSEQQTNEIGALSHAVNETRAEFAEFRQSVERALGIGWEEIQRLKGQRKRGGSIRDLLYGRKRTHGQ